MILDIYKESIKYSIKNSKELFYFSLTLFSNFIIWMIYVLILFNYQNIDSNLKFVSLIVPIILTVIFDFLFLGYEYKILQNSINGSNEVPKFNNIKEMVINGAKMFAVRFIYFIIPVVILIITNIDYINNISGGIIGCIGAIIALLLSIVLFFITFISLSNMAAHDNFKKAFDFKEIKKVILKIGIVRYVLFYLGLLVIECIIIFVLFVIVMIATILLGTSTFEITYYVEPVWWAILIITNLLFSIIIALAELFKIRGIGLIYESIEE